MPLTFTPEDILDKDFFELLQVENLSPEKKKALLTEVGKTVHATVYVAIYSQLNEEDRRHLDTLTEDQVLPFLAQKGFDVPEMIFAEAQRYKLELAATVEEAFSELPELAQ